MIKKVIPLLAVFFLVSTQPASALFEYHNLKLGSGIGFTNINNVSLPQLDGIAIEYEGSVGKNVGLSVFYGGFEFPKGGAFNNVSAKGSIIGAGLRYYLQPFSNEAFSGFFTGIGVTSRKSDIKIPLLAPATGDGDASITGLNYFLEFGYTLVIGPLNAGLLLQGGFMNGNLGFAGGIPDISQLPKALQVLKDIPPGDIAGTYSGVRGYVSFVF